MGKYASWNAIVLAAAINVACLLFCDTNAIAQAPPPGKNSLPPPLDSWSFTDTNYWTSDLGYAPVSFANIRPMSFGDGTSVIVNTNVPAGLQYNTVETSGTNEIAVNTGSVTFWFAPNWSSTNDDAGDGLGPQEYGRLLEIGGYTPASSFGWWSIYVDNVGANIYFSSQTNDGLGNTYTISAPIDWTTNYWHFVSLTYSPTNVSLYLDGALMTNDTGGLNIYPGADALANGFFVGSDSNGIYQAEGEIDDLKTYNVVLNTNQVNTAYSSQRMNYFLNPNNYRYMIIPSAPSAPSYTPTFNVISGQGNLQWVTNASTCTYGSTPYQVWLTNIVTTTIGSGSNMTENVKFTIEGGWDGVPYDVYANAILDFSTNTNLAWAWMGQGYHCNTYMLTNLPVGVCFLILGTPQDTSGMGLTDAYELLVLKTNPYGSQTDSYGVPYAWYAMNGLFPQGAATADPDQDGLLNYQEYQYGTRPTVSEGFSIWVNTTTSIP